MKALNILAADIKDLYYQDFTDSNEGFFDQEFFERQVQDAYAAILQDVFDKTYGLLRGEGNHKINMVSFDSQWLLREEIEIREGRAELKFVPMSFRYDQSECGIQDVIGSCNFIRIKYDEQHKFNHIVSSNEVFWWTERGENTELYFKGTCKEKAKVYYIPTGTNAPIADSAADDIKKAVLALLWEAKRGGYPPDEINDSSKTIKKEQGE